MLKRVLRKKLVLAGALAFSVSLLAPIGAKAQGLLPYSPCDMEYTGYFDFDGELSGNLDITLHVMDVTDLEAYLSLITTDISIINSGEDIEVSGLVRALSKNDQFLMFNYVDNYEIKNEATVSGDALKNAEGNINANVAAGDFNAQSNIAAIAVGEEEASLVESKTFSVQKTKFNEVNNEGVTNTASASDNVLSSAKGNIGLNIAAGSNNAQTNQLGIAVGPAKVGMSVAYIQQKSKYNTVSNQPIIEETEGEIPIELTLQMSENISGNLDGTYSGTEEGTIWYGPGQPENDYSGTEEGTFSGDINIENIELTGTITGSIPIGITNINTTNTASLSGSVLSGAVGNIGVNVAAGSNNLQANALSVTYIPEGEPVPVFPISPEL
ncbi:hypothetical protein DRN73_09225 [Candidatus Pacearchaeota archaeon]|nr:MAG: hypothetical protein DRN73_09225 [Candidatus Pacearchaeota archaeon]